jgi:hypothetical protein
VGEMTGPAPRDVRVLKEMAANTTYALMMTMV